MEYESLAGLIEPYIDGRFDALPESLRERVLKVFIVSWDNLTPNQRQLRAQEHDISRDPALVDSQQFEAQAAYDVVGLNGAQISWRYWVHQMPILSSSEAARLMSALDPDKFHGPDSRPGRDNPYQHYIKAENIQRLAEREGMASATPSAWLAWAIERQIKVCDLFRIEVERLSSAQTEHGPPAVLAGAPGDAQGKATEAPAGGAGTAAPSPVLAVVPEWSLTEPERYQGYGKPMYDLLKAAHIAFQPRPKARDVLDAWKKNPPLEVTEVMADGIKYLDANGNTKTADLDAIRATINRMTTV